MPLPQPSYERYQRQIILPAFGEGGQAKLQQSKVLVIGAGGLGCPVLQYLVAAGIGNIGIVDDDVVALSNLHRQPLFSMEDIGQSKAIAAAAWLKRLNPDINIVSYNQRLSTSNALALLQQYEVVVDGSDNFATRYLVNDACVLMQKPLVYGAVARFEGQVAIFNHGGTEEVPAVNYRDLFPNPPKDGEVLNCAEAGVLGILPGIIGCMQANETIKLITGIGKPLSNALLTYNALNNQVYEVALSANANNRWLLPADAAAFENTNYEWLCASADPRIEIDIDIFGGLLNNDTIAIIDVREQGEQPTPAGFDFSKMPLSNFSEAMKHISHDRVVLFCQSGKRSLQAARLLIDKFGATKKISSLRGGILPWVNKHTT